MRGIPPSLRYRKRYIVFGVICETRIREQELIKELWRNLVSLFGEDGSAGSQMWLEKFVNGKGIVRCAHEFVEKIKIAILTLNKIEGKNVLPVIYGVYGTLKKAEEKLLKEGEINATTSNGIR